MSWTTSTAPPLVFRIALAPGLGHVPPTANATTPWSFIDNTSVLGMGEAEFAGHS